jgi:hypothetical protein
MKAKRFLAAALVLAAAACSTAPAADTGPEPAPTVQAGARGAMDPVGRYEFSTSVQGQAITGGVEISGTPGSYTGRITTSITPPLPISSVTVEGQSMIVTGMTPDGVLTFRMNFSDATSFTGGWELDGDTGQLTGRKVS